MLSVDIAPSHGLGSESLLRNAFHFLVLLGFLLHSSSASACALSQVLSPNGPCCYDDCGDCGSACQAASPTGDAAASDGDHDDHDDGDLCLCKAKGASALSGHATAIAPLAAQPIVLLSADLPSCHWSSPAMPVAAVPPEVGRGLPLLF